MTLDYNTIAFTFFFITYVPNIPQIIPRMFPQCSMNLARHQQVHHEGQSTLDLSLSRKGTIWMLGSGKHDSPAFLEGSMCPDTFMYVVYVHIYVYVHVYVYRISICICICIEFIVEV